MIEIIDLLRGAYRLAEWTLEQGERARRWRTIAGDNGLTDAREVRTLGFVRRLEASAGPSLRVVFTASVANTEDHGGTIRISGLAPGLDGPAGPGPRRLGGAEVPRAHQNDVPPVAGPALLLCALLDAPTRRLVRGLFDERIDGEDGRVQGWSCRARLSAGVLTIAHAGPLFEDQVFGALRVARCLVAPAELEPAAAAMARTDPEPWVRAHALRTLAQEAPGHPATRGAVEASLADAAPEVRLAAAPLAGEAGNDVLRALVADPGTPDAIAGQAIRALGAALASTQARALLSEALATGRTPVLLACIQLLGARGPTECDAIGAALAYAVPEVVIAAAGALEASAARADAVVALREAEVRHSGNRAVRNAARAAVAAIQARLQGAEAGQLSVASPDAGTLALADDARGRVAMPAAADAPDGGRERPVR